MLRAEAHLVTEEYQEALNDYNKAAQDQPKNRKAQEGKQKAQLELKKSQRKDYYKILGITKSATASEIKKAFRKKALLYHPDRHSTEEAKVEPYIYYL